jgi:hypothetical protein
MVEVEQGEALEHPRQRGHPPGKQGEAAAHRSFLPMGRVEKLGRRRRSPMRWGLRWPVGSCVMWGGRGSSGASVSGEKGGKWGGARGSAHCGGVHDGRGGQTTAVARSDRGTTLRQRCGQLRTWETARSGWARVRRGEVRRGRCRQRGSVFGHGPVGNGRSERLLTRTRAPRHRRPRQPSRARRRATLPLTAGPHMSVFFRIKNYSRTKIAQNK